MLNSTIYYASVLILVYVKFDYTSLLGNRNNTKKAKLKPIHRRLPHYSEDELQLTMPCDFLIKCIHDIREIVLVHKEDK